jgi:hypothetical protein
MTDDIMRDLVTKHDAVITSLVSSVEHLVQSQTDTNKKLEEITKLLSQQTLLSTKLEQMDKELVESFKRVHHRIDEVDNLQKSDLGCNSVRLLTKDIESLTKDTMRLVGLVEDHRQNLEMVKKIQNGYPSTTAIRWGIGVLIAYSITFGTYVVQSIGGLSQTDARVLTLLERDIRDTAILMEHLKVKGN